MPSQAPLCFNPGSLASDRTEGKKKGRPKAENQALRDIPVSSRGRGGLARGLPVRSRPPRLASHTSSPKLSVCVCGPLCTSGLHGVAGA